MMVCKIYLYHMRRQDIKLVRKVDFDNVDNGGFVAVRITDMLKELGF